MKKSRLSLLEGWPPCPHENTDPDSSQMGNQAKKDKQFASLLKRTFNIPIYMYMLMGVNEYVCTSNGDSE